VDRDRTLRAIAARLEKAAARARERGDAESALDMQEAVVDLLVMGSPEEARLLASNQSDSIRRMVNAERVRHSRGSTGEDPFKVAANEAHYTIRSLAEKLGVSHASLSLARKGERSIERSLAEKIEKLTGFQATKGNWPKLKG